MSGQSPDIDVSKSSVDAVVDLGRLVLQFARTDRATCFEDGHTPESDTDHTVILGLVACAFAQAHLPHLDLGKIAQFVFVHDLVEAYAGDTPTLRVMTADVKGEKEKREQEALLRIQKEFSTLPWIFETIQEYESRRSPEARYVKALDKAIPKITHILNAGATLLRQGLTAEDVRAIYDAQKRDMLGYAADLPEVMDLRDELIREVLKVTFAQ